MPGEHLGKERFDGRRKVALYPGDLPASLDEALKLDAPAGGERDVALVRFRPTRIGPDNADGSPQPWPHIRLDRALEYLLGDRLG